MVSRPDISVVLMSGYPGDAIVDGDLSSPRVSFLAKPFGVNALVSTVRESLDVLPPVR